MFGKKRPRWKPPPIKDLDPGWPVWSDELDSLCTIKVCSCKTRCLRPMKIQTHVGVCPRCRKAL